MTNQFVWNGARNQVFDSSYGSQTVLCTDPASFYKYYTTFTATAPGDPVVFEQHTKGNDDISWTDAKIQVTKNSDVTFDFKNNVKHLSAYDTASPFEVSSATLKIANIETIALGIGFILTNNANFIIKGVAGLFMSYPDGAGLSITDSQANLAIDTIMNVNQIISDHGVFDITVGECLVHSKLRLSKLSIGSIKCNEFYLGGQGGSEYSISENSSLTIQTGSVKIEGTFITLGEGNSRVSIKRIPGQDPVDLTSLATSKKGFNFVGTKDTNTSELALDFSHNGESGNTAFARYWLWENDLVSVNGIPQHDESILSFDVSSSGMTIKFRTKV